MFKINLEDSLFISAVKTKRIMNKTQTICKLKSLERPERLITLQCLFASSHDCGNAIIDRK